jgi:hypothetical protein
MKRRLDDESLREIADLWREAGPDIVSALTDACERADAHAVSEISGKLRSALASLEAEVRRVAAR